MACHLFTKKPVLTRSLIYRYFEFYGHKSTPVWINLEVFVKDNFQTDTSDRFEPLRTGPGGHFTKKISVPPHIWWKFHMFSATFWWSDGYKILHMTRQLRCRVMSKILLQFVILDWDHSKIISDRIWILNQKSLVTWSIGPGTILFNWGILYLLRSSKNMPNSLKTGIFMEDFG